MTDTPHATSQDHNQDILPAKFVLNKYRIIFVALTLVAVGLAACSGGKSGSGPISSLESIRELTDMTAPVETTAAQKARAPGIASRSDSLIISTMYVETNDDERPNIILGAQCTGTECTISEPSIRFFWTFTLSDLVFVAGSPEAVGTKHGITLMSETGRRMDDEFTRFGAWMAHGGFQVETTRDLTPDDFRMNFGYGLAWGDLTGSRPTGSVTWLGLMVGTPATGDNFGDRLQGDAALNYDMSAGGGLDVAFSSIKNIDRGTAHTIPTVLFTDVPISSSGTFKAGFAGNRIQGGFYGPDHIEAAGIFEQSNIVGAFGAKR